MVSCSECMGRWCRVIARVVFVVTNNLYCIPAYVVWMMALRPLKTWLPGLYWKLEGLLFHWLLAMVALWSWSAGYDIAEVGDDITPCVNSRTLVIANHQSTGDVPLLMTAFNAKPGVLPRLMWIMDRLFRYTNFGIVSVLHGDFFIVSGKAKRDASVEQLRNHLRTMYMPIDRNFIVLFPEGGFLRKRRETSQRYAAKNNLPYLNNVSLPRVGALKVIVDEVGPYSKSVSLNGDDHRSLSENNTDQPSSYLSQAPSAKLHWILDVTIGYDKGNPLDLTSIVTGMRPPCVTHLHYRLYPSTDIPKDHEGMTQWLFKCFEEKEKLLEHFYRTGSFPVQNPDNIVRSNKPVMVKQDRVRFIYLSMFFILSTFLQIHIFYVLYQSAVSNVGLIVK